MKRISWLLSFPLVLSVALVPLACVESWEFVLAGSQGGMGGAGGASSSMSTTSSSGGGSVSSSSGGAGGMGDCTTKADCKDTECKTAMACDKGTCVWTNTPEGTATASQLYGDCKDRKCDGNGGVVELPGDMVKDLYDWGNPCYSNACNAQSMPVATEPTVMCKTPWGNLMGVCSNFECVDCVDDTDCATNTCRSGHCILSACTNLTTDGNETDTDCGGPDCTPCGANKTCTKNTDCEGTCNMASMKCAAPTCSDGVRNGGETDIDCGGSCAKGGNAAKCKTMQICLYPGDCESGVCIAGKCQDPTCSDYTQNQMETGIDCGGSCGACPL